MVGVNLPGATLTGYTGCDGITIACLWEVAARFVFCTTFYFTRDLSPPIKIIGQKPGFFEKSDNVQLRPSGPPGVSGFQLLARLLVLRSFQSGGGEGRGQGDLDALSE